MTDAEQNRPWGEGPTYFEQIGGEATVRRIVTRFYDRLKTDPMIGFFFNGKNIERLVEMEVRFSAHALGDPTPYRGRSIAVAHQNLRIFGGQHLRRLQVLREEIQREGLPEPIELFWLAHQEAQRSQVTGDKGSRCARPVGS